MLLAGCLAPVGLSNVAKQGGEGADSGPRLRHVSSFQTAPPTASGPSARRSLPALRSSTLGFVGREVFSISSQGPNMDGCALRAGKGATRGQEELTQARLSSLPNLRAQSR